MRKKEKEAQPGNRGNKEKLGSDFSAYLVSDYYFMLCEFSAKTKVNCRHGRRKEARGQDTGEERKFHASRPSKYAA